MLNVMDALPNTGGTLCESSVIPFLVPRHNVWLTPVSGVPCTRLGRKVNFAPSKILSRATAPENVYIVYQHRRRPNIVQSLAGLQ